MFKNPVILNELESLGSTLAKDSLQNCYTVPVSYFEGLAFKILNRIKALETSDPKRELELLSFELSSLNRETPYTVPVNYFENLSEELMLGIREHADYQSPDEELETLSPILGKIRDKNPYSVPEGYFENLVPDIQKEETKVVSILRRRWYRFAVAASIIGILAISGIVVFRQKTIDPNRNPQAWIDKNVNKKVSEEKLDELIILAKGDDGLKEENVNTANVAEVKELMNEVPEKEIQDFLNDAIALGSNDGTDVLLN